MQQGLLPPNQRIPAMDVLRVAAIGILIFYHHLMIYVPGWDFHFKDEMNAVWLPHLLLLTSPWRMGLLWLISGIALRFALARSSGLRLGFNRSVQLLFPLLVGILIVVPPQLYVEMRQAGDMPLGYGDFWLALIFDQQSYFKDYSAGIWPAIDVNHLWFLRSLWQFSLLALLIAPALKTAPVLAAINWLAGRPWVLLSIVVPVVAAIDATTVGDTSRNLYGAIWFFSGFMLGRYGAFWDSLGSQMKPLTMLALLSLFAVQLGYLFVWQQQDAPLWMESVAVAGYTLNRAVLPLTLLAIAYALLNRPHRFLSTFNDSVYPLYIIHQTVSIVIAAVVAGSVAPARSAAIHLLISLPASLIINFTLLAVIRHSAILRFCFGMRAGFTKPAFLSLSRAAAFIICLPLAFAILL